MNSQSISEILSARIIDLDGLKELTFNFGCPDSGSDRALCWRLLLGALPKNRTEWSETLLTQRENYKMFVNDFVIKSEQEKSSESCDPLSNTGTEWDTYFKDNDVLTQIDKDARRLYPDLGFFSLPTKNPAHERIHPDYRLGCLRDRIERANLATYSSVKQRNGAVSLQEKKKSNDDDDFCKMKEGEEANWEVVERILFVYAKLNQGTKYIQGMNEIIGPIYYVLSSDPDEKWSRYAEADTFYCFTRVMSEIRDNFIQSMDSSTSGIHANMNKVFTLLKIHDYSIWQVLHDQEIKPQFFLFRWMTLLLSQEMRIPDTIRLWDTLFSDSSRFDLLNYVCVAILVLIRESLIDGDFGHNMRLLQNTADVLPDIQTIIQKADQIRQKDRTKKPPIGRRLKNSVANVNKKFSKSFDSLRSQSRDSTGDSFENVKKRFSSFRKLV